MPSSAGRAHAECVNCSTIRAEAQRMSLARDITTVGSGTLAIAAARLFRATPPSRLFSAPGPFAEALFAVLQVVNFFRRLLAEGALNSAFVPLWLRLKGGEDGAANADRFTIRSPGGDRLHHRRDRFAGRDASRAPDHGRDRARLRRRPARAGGILSADRFALHRAGGTVAVIAAALNAQGHVGAVAASTASSISSLLAALTVAFTAHVEHFFGSAFG